MKAILCTNYGTPEVLKSGIVDRPVPKDNEVLVKIYAATVTPGDCELRRFDIHVLFWLPLRIYLGIIRPQRPILGMEVAGEVVAIGTNVENYKVGDLIFGGTGMMFGAYAEYICLNEKGMMAIKPNNMTFEEAATLPTGGNNALHYMRMAEIRPGEKILIKGAGGCFGTYAVQLAKYFGAEVTAVDSADKLDVLTSIGADHVIDYNIEDFTDHGEIYDIIFDVVKNSDVPSGMKALKQNGRYVMANPDVLPVLKGYWSSLKSRWSKKPGCKKLIIELAKERSEDLLYLKELIEAGKLKSIIDKTYQLDQMQEAHRYVEGGEKTGHVVIKVAES